jgi:hypothetical protein
MAAHALIPVLTYIRPSLRKRRPVHCFIAERALDFIGYSISHTQGADVNQGVTQWGIITGVPEYEASIAVFHQRLPSLLGESVFLIQTILGERANNIVNNTKGC